PLAKLRIARGQRAEVAVTVDIKPGCHVNSHLPGEDSLIPLRLSWESKPFRVLELSYPKPSLQKYEFSEKPLSVFSGTITIQTRLEAPPDAPRGPGILLGSLRYQACTDKLCFPPRTVQVRLPYEIN
ncbi:MAG: protein-disulfide reductase DsbD domain-containing protein, partial [Bryobacteraceae bacterium]